MLNKNLRKPLKQEYESDPGKILFRRAGQKKKNRLKNKGCQYLSNIQKENMIGTGSGKICFYSDTDAAFCSIRIRSLHERQIQKGIRNSNFELYIRTVPTRTSNNIADPFLV